VALAGCLSIDRLSQAQVSGGITYKCSYDVNSNLGRIGSASFVDSYK